VEQKEKDKVFGSYFNPLATQFTGFSVCHPLYDDSAMLNMVRHTIYSSLSTESATATFLLLPNWKGLNANAYMQMLKTYPEHCTILGTIPQASVTYRRQDLWIGNNASSPAPEWDLEIIVIWNKEAQHMLFDARSITMAPNFTALTNDNLRLKVPDWRLWAYTDGSCLTYKSQQRVGAGVFIPAT